jgi:hypothetical protein
VPTSSFDTFFACTILVAAALIGTAFLATTMEARITSTNDLNKDSYLKAISDHILTNPGTPADWGTSSALPADFGLAAISSTNAYELDIDKVCRLNTLNSYSLTYPAMEKASKLNNIALGITVSQLMTINVLQTSNSTLGSNTSFTFTVSTFIDSKPTSSSLHSYVAAENYVAEISGSIPDTGVGEVTVKIPSVEMNNALFIVFAQSSIDSRLTSYTIYNFAHSTQETTPVSRNLGLSTLDYTLRLDGTTQGLAVQNSYVFSYSYQHPLSVIGGSYPIPKLIDKSPLILVVCGLNGTEFIQEWTAYPQVPLKVGADFTDSERNIFSYIVTINGVLYRLDLCLGDLPP